jgi:SAM-dependent methyltransferase
MRNSICICCANESVKRSFALISSFLSKRALLCSPRADNFYECQQCGFRWSALGLTDEQAARLYIGYRGEEYFQERHSFEPWYSRALNDGIGAEGDMSVRRKTLFEILNVGGVNPEQLTTVADHGGDRGQMLLDFVNARKMVYDVSGVSLENGVEAIARVADFANTFELVLTCHVLEHLNDPRQGLLEAVSLAKSGGYVYVELPYESWSGPWQPKFQDRIIQWLINYPRLLKFVDFFVTGMKVKLGWIPPLGFNVIREHLQYFTEKSIINLMQSSNLRVMHVTKKGQFLIALGQKL